MSMPSNALPAAGGFDSERLPTAALTVAGGRLAGMNEACGELLGVDCAKVSAGGDAPPALANLIAELERCGGPFDLLLDTSGTRACEVLAGPECDGRTVAARYQRFGARLAGNAGA